MAADESLIDSSSPPPSTSNFTFFETKDDVFLCDFEKLAIDCDRVQQQKAVQKMSPTGGNYELRTPKYKQGRFTPYSVPINMRWRRLSLSNSSNDPETMSKAILKGDVEPLKLCLIDRKDLTNAPCSVQAARPPSPDEDVDELSEYFAHFVRVESKMSALAESMYV
ncbi:unnamed protein product [Caenorhabditis angaria]|uniref:Oxidative stress-responsive serine-rich protein 1 n=1 Tax=Caenorhabditis angaria TaxID=860376 RepID=A0A9P1I3V1_9PELO|nr:unnamed protein product [Caenorhabditis angaria]